METTIENLVQERVQDVKYTTSSSSPSLLKRYDRFIEGLKFSHFSVIAMAILIGSCLGSIAAMCVFYNGGPTWAFGVGLFATMANLVACISQAPTKWVVNLFLLSVIVNVALMAVFPIF